MLGAPFNKINDKNSSSTKTLELIFLIETDSFAQSALNFVPVMSMKPCQTIKHQLGLHFIYAWLLNVVLAQILHDNREGSLHGVMIKVMWSSS